MIELLSGLIHDAIKAAVEAGGLNLTEIPEPHLERPRDPSHGDWATNVAMQLAKDARMAPRQIAEVIADQMNGHEDIAAVEIAGPGFINIRLSGAALQRVLRDVRDHGADYGRVDIGKGRRVQVEFVSANPVGPMHVGHGRWAALGDSMARVLEHAGFVAQREFYVNDAGVQMDTFAKSVAARYMEMNGVEVEFADDWYQGSYIRDIAQEIMDAEGPKWVDADSDARESHFKEQAYTQVLAHLKRVLHGMGVDFDVWFSERTLHEPAEDGVSAVESAILTLREAGYIYEKDGATWFRTTDF